MNIQSYALLVRLCQITVTAFEPFGRKLTSRDSCLFGTSKVSGSCFYPENINLSYLTVDVYLVVYMILPLVLTSNGVNLNVKNDFTNIK